MVSSQHQIIDALIYHKRMAPKINKFHYRIFNLLINLKELSGIEARGITLNKPGLISIFEKDYGPRDGSSLEKWFCKVMEDYHLPQPHHLLLMTVPKIMGYVFNPVSFYLAFDKENVLYAVIAEVNNTFRDHHFYLISDGGKSIANRDDLSQLSKVFYVSPFYKIEGTYQFKFRLSEGKIGMFIDYYVDGKKTFESYISGHLKQLNKQTLIQTALRYPTQIFKIILLIHYQALKLWIKRIAYHSKSPPPKQILTASRTFPTKSKHSSKPKA